MVGLLSSHLRLNILTQFVKMNEFVNAENRRMFGDDYLKILIQELKSSGKRSSGKLINSLDFRVTSEGQVIQMVFEGEDYFKYVDEGRRPGNFPPIKDIASWARIKGIPQAAVYPIAKSIFKFGIKPTNVFEKANNKALNGQPFKNLEDNITSNVESMVIKEMNKLKEL